MEGKEKANKRKVTELQQSAAKSLQDGDMEEAIVLLTRAIFLDDKDPDLYDMRAVAFQEIGDMASALNNLKKVVFLRENGLAKAKVGLLTDILGLECASYSSQEAISMFSRAIELDSLHPTFWVHRALAKLHCGLWNDSMKDIDHAVLLDSSRADLFILRGKMHWNAGNVEKGNRDFHTAANIDSNHVEILAFYEIAGKKIQQALTDSTSLMLTGKSESAIQQLDDAISVHPENIKLRIKRATLLWKQGRLSRALFDLEVADREVRATEVDSAENDSLNGFDAVQKNPVTHGELQNPQNITVIQRDVLYFQKYHSDIAKLRISILNDIAISHFKEGDYQTALTLFNKIINSTKASSLPRRESTMHVTNPHAETEQDSLYNFLSSVLQHPQDLSAGSDIVDFRFYLHRGDCYRSLSKLQPALADYHTALEMWTRNSTSMLTQRQGKNGDWPIRCRLGMVHHQIAMKLYNEGEYGQSEVEFSAALANHPGVAQYLLYRGHARFFQHKFDLAYEDYIAVLQVDHENHEARRKLMQFRLSNDGKEKEAYRSNSPELCNQSRLARSGINIVQSTMTSPCQIFHFSDNSTQHVHQTQPCLAQSAQPKAKATEKSAPTVSKTPQTYKIPHIPLSKRKNGLETMRLMDRHTERLESKNKPLVIGASGKAVVKIPKPTERAPSFQKTF